MAQNDNFTKPFILFKTIDEYTENLAKLLPTQIAFVQDVGKIFVNGTNYSGIVRGLEQIPQIQFTTSTGTESYLDTLLELYLTADIKRSAKLPVVTTAATGLMTPKQLALLQTLQTSVQSLQVSLNSANALITTLQAKVTTLENKVNALEEHV